MKISHIVISIFLIISKIFSQIPQGGDEQNELMLGPVSVCTVSPDIEFYLDAVSTVWDKEN